ncbi:MAG TPA: methyl-accepting chemotaxis protein [Candidatus Acidoferrales bacterium]|jgi:methyl-accepting chemotaxis protein|nr:methyl-accepting chemotaxis protein [Candidatus Acidoferrales bacterium]
MNITKKIWIGFGILIAMMIAGSGVGYFKSKNADAESHHLVEVNLAEHDAAQNAQDAMREACIQEQLFILSKDSNAIPSFQAAMDAVKKHLDELGKVSPSAERRAEAVKAATAADACLGSFQKLVTLKIRRGLTQSEGLEGEMREAVHQVETKVQNQGLAELTVNLLMCRRHEKDYLLRGDPAYLDQIQQCIKDFSAQMKQFSLADNLQKEIMGSWDNYFKAMQALVEGDQGIKQEQATFMAASQSIQDQVTTIETAASADLDASNRSVLLDLTLGKRANLYGILISGVVGIIIAFWVARSLGVITRTIFNAVTAISNGTNQTAESSQQVTSASHTLAEGASEQAASIEETSASLEEMASMTKRNASNAEKANELAKQTRSAADKGAEDMQAMSTAMETIKKSSDDIAKIIRTIDEIAFQTNILALNAAVEAARAGEAGMGFAVVADEVRNLAQRSAQAAKETAAKIEGAIVNTSRGVELSQKVATTLNDIVGKAREMDDLAAEVAGASREQTQGITQINTAVSQMDKVTQSNAASAEESAAAAQELNNQAQGIKDAVQELLKLVGGNDKASAAEKESQVFGPAKKSVAPKKIQHNGNGDHVSRKTTGANRTSEIPLEDAFKNF